MRCSSSVIQIGNCLCDVGCFMEDQDRAVASTCRRHYVTAFLPRLTAFGTMSQQRMPRSLSIRNCVIATNRIRKDALSLVR